VAGRRVERRLAAVLAADIAGYSRLMGVDEVGTARALRDHRTVTDELVAKHGGRIVKTTGDGVLVEFPSVVDAVECAIAVQAVMTERNGAVPEDRRMLFRIGINLGDVLIDGDDILGDGVNVAARLESIAEPGGICISSSAYEQVRGKVPVDFTDLGEQTLKNIARPIRLFAVGPSADTGRTIPSQLSSAPRLSIVVLPFANIGGAPEQEYFADGVTESLTTDLSRVNGLLVIARNTAFTLKGKHVDVKKLGRELNVRYVLEGSVQRSGNRVRVNVQLIDAESGNHLWGERFDKPVANLFDMQDEIVSRLARALDVELMVAEARRAERSLHPDVMDLVFQGWAWFNKGLNPDQMAKARSFFQQALSLDPANIEAMVGLSFVDACVGTALMADDVSGRLAAAEATITKVLSLEPNHALARAVLALIQTYTKRADQAIAECEHALALDRNCVHAHALIGFAKYQLGRAAETEAHIDEAFRLSPRDPYAGSWCSWVALAKGTLNLDSDVIVWLRRAIEANRNFSLAYFLLAGRLARLGDLEQARAKVQAGLALDPSFTIRRMRQALSAFDNPTVVAARERGIEGMRLAGVPEG
jgi:TolB-like protein/class 3 adenylate cyclase